MNIYIYIYIYNKYIYNTYIYTYMVFTAKGFFKAAIESWPEWDLNPSMTTEFRSDALTN